MEALLLHYQLQLRAVASHPHECRHHVCRHHVLSSSCARVYSLQLAITDETGWTQRSFCHEM